MTTVAQVKQAMQPLLRRNADLALVGRLVVIKPVHHILRGIFIDRSLGSTVFVPKWAVIFLFEPSERFSFNWGYGEYRLRAERGAWDIRDPQTPASMCEEIERFALPLLRPVQTIDDFVRFTTKENFNWTPLDTHRHRKVFVDVARGDLEAARETCAYFATDDAKRWYLPHMHEEGDPRRHYSPDMQEEYDRVAKTLCPLLAANDRPGLVRLLKEYEAYSVKKLKLEKLWEPTPFPLELQSDRR